MLEEVGRLRQALKLYSLTSLPVHSLFPEWKCSVTSQPSALSFWEVTEAEAGAASHVTSAVKKQGDGDSAQLTFSISYRKGASDSKLGSS